MAFGSNDKAETLRIQKVCTQVFNCSLVVPMCTACKRSPTTSVSNTYFSLKFAESFTSATYVVNETLSPISVVIIICKKVRTENLKISGEGFYMWAVSERNIQILPSFRHSTPGRFLALNSRFETQKKNCLHS